jgi:hypothetical protein
MSTERELQAIRAVNASMILALENMLQADADASFSKREKINAEQLKLVEQKQNRATISRLVSMAGKANRGSKSMFIEEDARHFFIKKPQLVS